MQKSTRSVCFMQLTFVHVLRKIEPKKARGAGSQALRAPHLRFWRIFGGLREKLPFPQAVFTILSENNRREKLLR